MNKKKIIIGIVIVVLLFAIICTICILIFSNTLKGKLVGKWQSNTSSFEIEFRSDDKCTTFVSNNSFFMDESSQNQIKTNVDKYVGTYKLDDKNNQLTISIDGSINSVFQWTDKPSGVENEWSLSSDGVLSIGLNTYVKE